MADRVRIIVTSKDPQALRDLISTEDLDVSCGGAKKSATGEWTIEAHVSTDVEARIRAAGYSVQPDYDAVKRADARRAEVAKGDRFQRGKIPPRGVGRKE